MDAGHIAVVYICSLDNCYFLIHQVHVDNPLTHFPFNAIEMTTLGLTVIYILPPIFSGYKLKLNLLPEQFILKAGTQV